MSEVAL